MKIKIFIFLTISLTLPLSGKADVVDKIFVCARDIVKQARSENNIESARDVLKKLINLNDRQNATQILEFCKSKRRPFFVRKLTPVNWEKYEKDFKEFVYKGKFRNQHVADFIHSVIRPGATCTNYLLSVGVAMALSVKMGAGVGYCKKTDGEIKMFLIPEVGGGFGFGTVAAGGRQTYELDWRKGVPIQKTIAVAILAGMDFDAGKPKEFGSRRIDDQLGVGVGLGIIESWDLPPLFNKFSFLHLGNDFGDWREKFQIKIPDSDPPKKINEGKDLENFVIKNSKNFQKPPR